MFKVSLNLLHFDNNQIQPIYELSSATYVLDTGASVLVYEYDNDHDVTRPKHLLFLTSCKISPCYLGKKLISFIVDNTNTKSTEQRLEYE